jgi:hemoglobin
MAETVYEAAGGRAGMVALAGAWHRRVVADEVVGHAFQRGVDPHHVERLAAYWGEALGGPPTFSTAYGDGSSVARIHGGNGEHREMDDRAVACFDGALGDVGLAGTPLGDVLHAYFAWATRTAMNAYPDSPDDVPDGLDVPRWTWDGLATG